LSVAIIYRQEAQSLLR